MHFDGGGEGFVLIPQFGRSQSRENTSPATVLMKNRWVAYDFMRSSLHC
jgi:hypothetical protein